MRRKVTFVIAFVLAFSVLLPAVAGAASGSASYQFDLEVPNVSEASNGDRVSLTGEGEFSLRPNSVTGGGNFTHMFAAAGSLSGTWTATELLEFQPYGCGVVHNFPKPGDTTPLPDNACGGALKVRVLLTVAGFGSREGILTIFCIIGDNPPNSHDDPTGEGINLVVPGIVNFNKIVTGMNVFIKTSGAAGPLSTSAVLTSSGGFANTLDSGDTVIIDFNQAITVLVNAHIRLTDSDCGPATNAGPAICSGGNTNTVADIVCGTNATCTVQAGPNGPGTELAIVMFANPSIVAPGSVGGVQFPVVVTDSSGITNTSNAAWNIPASPDRAFGPQGQ